MENPTAKSLFRTEMIDYARSRNPTQRKGLKAGLIFLAFAIVAPLLLIELPLVAAGIVVFETMRVAFYICWFALVASAIVVTVRSIIRPTRRVTCWKCNYGQDIFADIRKYVCTECGNLTLLGNDKVLAPQLSDCPYCGLRTAVTSDYGIFVCSNCGVSRDSEKVVAPQLERPCPRCGNRLPNEAFFCSSCNQTILAGFHRRVDFAFLESLYLRLGNDLRYMRWGQTEPWDAGRDASGHLIYARAILDSIESVLPKAEKINILGRCLLALANALVALEDALLDSPHNSMLPGVLHRVDEIYSGVLAAELRLLDLEVDVSSRLDVGSPPKPKYPLVDLRVLIDEPHITARKRIEDRISKLDGYSGGPGSWQERLLKVTVVDEGKAGIIEDFSKVRDEAQRFTNWRLHHRATEVR